MSAAEPASACARIGAAADALGVAGLSEGEAGALALELALGEAELEAVAAVLERAAEERRRRIVDTLLQMSRLPATDPKTFGNFDFDRIGGKDSGAISRLPSLAALYARRNVALIGPSGVGKTHLADAFGRKCCELGLKTYRLKAKELKDKLERACRAGSTARAVSSLVKPSCLIIDEVGRSSAFDAECTNLFFDVIDRRYEKDGPNTLILTSNKAPSSWGKYFTGDDTLLCALDRIFDRADVYMFKGTSFRGSGLETYSVESSPKAPASGRPKAP